MQRFERAREQLDGEAIDFLRNGLYAGRPDDCPCYVHFGISAYDKKYRPKEYQEGIACFKALFQAGGRYRLALWNMILNYYPPKTKFRKGDFSKEEYAFLAETLKAADMTGEANVNPPIETERLVLRAIEGNDQTILADHFKSEGDFESFTGRKPTNKNMSLRKSVYFTIERKADRKILGYIGLSIKEASATGLLEYYLFKEERRKGYCKEAVGALTEIALRGKIYGPAETVQLGVYKRKVIHLNAIRARISSVNIASQRTVESCGFVHEATIHQTLYEGTGWTDEEIYYLTYSMIK